MKIIAHRGASGDYPENTLLAFDKAFETGADIVELDVQFTKDGCLVIFHDRDALRVANEPRGMIELSLKEIMDLDVGSWKGFQNIHIPTLKDVLERKYKSLIIELKPQNHPMENNFALEKKVLSLLEQYGTDLGAGYLSVRTIESYDFLKEHCDYPIGLMQKKRPPKEFISLVNDHQVEFSQIRWKTFNDADWQLLKDSGSKITAFFADNEEEWKFLMNMGIYGILTNYPQRLKNFLLTL